MSGVAWWSQTAASNATQDPTINFAEGQAPSSVNDSARALMASAAKWRDDITGAITTAGTSIAFTVSSYQTFDTLARLNGQMIAFTPHTTSGSTVTLNVDGLGAKPLRSAPSTDLVTGHLVQGTPYVAVYNSSDAAFYLQGFFGNPYASPIGGMLDFIGSTAPNSSFVFPYGQAISRATYSVLFALVSTAYGSGDGSTTFNVPDLRGRVIAGKDNMGGTYAGRLTGTFFGSDSGVLGNIGGGESQTLTAAQIPSITSSASNAITVTTVQRVVNGPNAGSAQGGGTQVTASDAGSGGNLSLLNSTGNNTITVNSNNTGGGAHRTVQPTIVLNKILRII
ncbi:MULTISPECIES: tail fiber protein [unclassified Bradyrhizobium]|uniref:phage tail protein n=1 Tax=unclassified Bradyrhizobium TaxID=2631580 RepID=UPI001FF72CC4|nr:MULTISPECIES: tail fiber protein [unclassified Bradyrhizobium]MCK1304706.1 tail fiber protein [Bradyrhizobium sp. 45]MCK1608575.1 tail fiber protein [Bradyrhizobium sp. 163]MCK1766347.1 tail fiber protein [Bradyrhizobium sp. 136]